jgi:hypothetical protein
MDRSAKWIWPAGQRLTVDYHWLARREFTLPAAPAEATLEITACDRYRLIVNGQLIGEGPSRSQWPEIYQDTYSLAELPLVRGRNAIGIVARNTGLAQHGQPPGPGGLLAQLVVTCGAGRRVVISTDASWRQLPAPHYAGQGGAPRRFFPSGFTERCDLRREPQGWAEPGFNDRAWAAADVVPARPASPYTRVTACPLPPLQIVPTEPVAVGRTGTVGGLDGLTGVPFEFCVFCCRDEEFYGATFVRSPRKQTVWLDFAADNRATVFLNNRHVLSQGKDDSFYTNLYYEADTYTGLYYGHGHRVSGAEVTLEAGWNSLGVVLGAPHDTWGFAMRFADLKTRRTLPLKFSLHRSSPEIPAWQVLSDTHLAGGEDGMLLEMPHLNAGTFPSPSHLAAWEPRHASPVAGAEQLLGGAKGTLRLPPNAFVTYRLPAELVGGIELQVRGEAGAVLDVTAGEVLRKDGCVDSLRDRQFLTDRVILSDQWATWRSLDRRAMRYIELVARNATKPVEIRALRVSAKHYPPPARGSFRSSDRVLNKLWAAGEATLDACTQEHFEDCPIREMAQWFGDCVVEGQVAAVTWGDAALTAKCLRQFGADQPKHGWMRAMVPGGYGGVLVDYALMYPYLLHRHWMYWDDRKVLRDCFPAVVRLMDHAATYVRDDDLIRGDDSPGHCVYLDHTVAKTTRGKDVVTGYQAVYVLSLERAADVAEAVGQKPRAKRWRAQAERTRQAVQGRLFDAERGLFVESLTGDTLERRFTATTNYLALLAGVPTAEQDAQIVANLWPDGADREPQDLWPPRENPYFKYFVLEALLSRGLTRQALAVIRRYYGPMMARSDFWTLYEMYDPRTKPTEPVATNSHCHAYGAGPLVHYFRWLCGLRPAEPGFSRMVVEPQLGDLTSIDAVLPTPRGMIEMTARGPAGRRRIVVTVPTGVTVDVRRTYLTSGDQVEERRA